MSRESVLSETFWLVLKGVEIFYPCLTVCFRVGCADLFPAAVWSFSVWFGMCVAPLLFHLYGLVWFGLVWFFLFAFFLAGWV